MLDRLRARVHHHDLHGHEHVNRQRERSLFLLIFGAVRIFGWTILGVCLVLGLLHAGPFTWAKTLATSVPFVALISVYANWATDLDAATAAFAALVASDSHHDAEAARAAVQLDMPAINADLRKLADLQPGVEAHQLARRIADRLNRG